ncbi:hypothetical protein EVAR_9267_1 [Eumeta japonica]|uniref:Uncharacterized protein n=1 Tax=Eumeta variegata TaxID=151549 RepID=A0A4C1TMV7_EUMVA|nr:hypothetical protein EVAR_9267_1 [Eumeta japonica]
MDYLHNEKERKRSWSKANVLRYSLALHGELSEQKLFRSTIYSRCNGGFGRTKELSRSAECTKRDPLSLGTSPRSG